MHRPDPLIELGKKYRASLPQKRLAIDEAWRQFARLRDGDDDSQALSLLVHRLAGSGASYGYLEVSECAIRFENLLDEWIENRSENQALDSLERALEALRQAIARAHAEGPEG